MLFKELKVIVDTCQGEVDSVFTFVVHADAHENPDSQRFLPLTLLIDCSSIFHFLELPDEPVRDIDLAEVSHVRGALIVVLGDVVSLNRARIYAEWSAGVVYLLLENSW